MSEQQQQQSGQDQESTPKYQNYIYTGKMLKSQGQTKDGKDWKLYSLLLKDKIEDVYPKKFSCFNTLTDKSIQVSNLEEGDSYHFGWKEKPYQHPEYGNQISKNVFYITDPRDESTNTQQPPSHQQQQKTQNPLDDVPTDTELNDFMKVYLKVCQSKGIDTTEAGFVKAYLKSKFKSSQLITALEGRYAQEQAKGKGEGQNTQPTEEEVVM